MLGIEITENVAAQRRQARVPEHGRAPRARVAGGRAHDGVGLRADQRLQGRRPARDADRAAEPQPRRADRQPGRLQRLAHASGSADGNDETIDDTVYIISKPGEYRRKNCRVGDTTTALCTFSVGLAENGVDPNRNYAQFWGGPGSDTNPFTQTYRGAGAVLGARVAQHPVARLAQPGDDADHQPHHGGARAARARPGRGRRPRGRAPRLQGARRRHGQGERLLLPEELRALRHHGHDRGLELQRHRRLRLHVRALLRRAQLRRPATATSPAFHPRFATMAKEWDGTSAQADHVGDPGPAATTARATARRTTSPPRARSTRRATRCSRAAAPAGARLRLTKDVQDRRASRARRQVDDHLETVLRRRRHRRVPLAREPVDAAARGQGGGSPNPGAPSPPQTRGRPVPRRRRSGALQRPRVHRPRGRRQRAAPTFRVTVGDARQRLGHQALPRTPTATASWTRASRVVGTLRAGPDRLAEQVTGRRTRRGAVRPARDELRGGRGLRGHGHLCRAAAVQARATESYTLTCERSTAAVVKTSQVVVERAAGRRACDAVPGGAARPPPRRRRSARSGADRSPPARARATPVPALGRQARAGAAALTARGTVTLLPASRATRRTARRPGFTNRWSKTARDGYYVVRGTGGRRSRCGASGGRFRVLAAVRARDVQRPGFSSAGRCSAGRCKLSYRAQTPGEASRCCAARRSSSACRRKASGTASLRLARGVYRVRFEAGDFTATLTSRRL